MPDASMQNENNHLDITLLGKEYRVACPPDEQDALLAAVAYVDEKMHDIADKTRSNISERIAVMAALNIAHELLTQNRSEGASASSGTSPNEVVDFGAVKRRIVRMEAQIDSILAPQDQLI